MWEPVREMEHASEVPWQLSPPKDRDDLHRCETKLSI